MKYVFIVNGKAGDNRALDKLNNELRNLKKKIDYEVYKTTGVKDATRFVEEYCSKDNEETCLVACGGDGTINEVASGLVNSKHHLGILAYGSGNDFVKSYEGLDFTSVEKLVEGTSKKIDIMKVNDKYAINICNFGFDAIVGSTANKVKEKGGKNPYGAGVRKAILTGRFNKIEVIADNEKISKKKMLLCTLANGSYVGGQYYCAPKSVNDDGYIDVCLFHTMSLLGFLKVLKPYTNGEHLDNPKFANKLVYRRVKHVEVNSDKEIELCLDGEMLPGKHFEINILEKAINFVVPKE